MAGVPGQGRRFDVETALDVAVREFWNHGYEATSVAHLTKLIGITPTSLYAAFGGKRSLFEACVARYLEGPGSWMDRVLTQSPDAVTMVRDLLFQAARHYTDPLTPRGCLLLNTGAGAGGGDEIADIMRARHQTNMQRLTGRMIEGSRHGHLPPDVDPIAASEFLEVTIQGMSARARDGATAAELEAVAAVALRALGVQPALSAR